MDTYGHRPGQVARERPRRANGDSVRARLVWPLDRCRSTFNRGHLAAGSLLPAMTTWRCGAPAGHPQGRSAAEEPRSGLDVLGARSHQVAIRPEFGGCLDTTLLWNNNVRRRRKSDGFGRIGPISAPGTACRCAPRGRGCSMSTRTEAAYSIAQTMPQVGGTQDPFLSVPGRRHQGRRPPGPRAFRGWPAARSSSCCARSPWPRHRGVGYGDLLWAVSTQRRGALPEGWPQGRFSSDLREFFEGVEEEDESGCGGRREGGWRAGSVYIIYTH